MICQTLLAIKLKFLSETETIVWLRNYRVLLQPKSLDTKKKESSRQKSQLSLPSRVLWGLRVSIMKKIPQGISSVFFRWAILIGIASQNLRNHMWGLEVSLPTATWCSHRCKIPFEPLCRIKLSQEKNKRDRCLEVIHCRTLSDTFKSTFHFKLVKWKTFDYEPVGNYVSFVKHAAVVPCTAASFTAHLQMK